MDEMVELRVVVRSEMFWFVISSKTAEELTLLRNTLSKLSVD